MKIILFCDVADQNTAKSPIKPDITQFTGQTTDQAGLGHFLSFGGRTSSEKTHMMIKVAFV